MLNLNNYKPSDDAFAGGHLIAIATDVITSSTAFFWFADIQAYRSPRRR